MVFLDTSAILAVIDADDRRHEEASQIWEKIFKDKLQLCTTNYVLLETISLLQARLGIKAVKDFQEDVFPCLKVWWISKKDHIKGVETVISRSRKKVSLVDCVSFETIRRHQIPYVFAFDKHFKEEDFTLLEK